MHSITTMAIAMMSISINKKPLGDNDINSNI